MRSFDKAGLTSSDLAAMYEAGMSLQQIAAKALPPMYEAGMSIQEIADATGLSYTTIHRLLGEAGVQLRRPGPLAGHRKQVPVAILVELYVEYGLSLQKVGKKVGLSPTTVRQRLVDEAKIAIRPPGPQVGEVPVIIRPRPRGRFRR